MIYAPDPKRMSALSHSW